MAHTVGIATTDCSDGFPTKHGFLTFILTDQGSLLIARLADIANRAFAVVLGGRVIDFQRGKINSVL